MEDDSELYRSSRSVDMERISPSTATHLGTGMPVVTASTSYAGDASLAAGRGGQRYVAAGADSAKHTPFVKPIAAPRRNAGGRGGLVPEIRPVDSRDYRSPVSLHSEDEEDLYGTGSLAASATQRFPSLDLGVRNAGAPVAADEGRPRGASLGQASGYGYDATRSGQRQDNLQPSRQHSADYPPAGFVFVAGDSSARSTQPPQPLSRSQAPAWGCPSRLPVDHQVSGFAQQRSPAGGSRSSPPSRLSSSGEHRIARASSTATSDNLQRKQIELESQEWDIQQQRTVLEREQTRTETARRELEERELHLRNRDAELGRRQADLEKRMETARRELEERELHLRNKDAELGRRQADLDRREKAISKRDASMTECERLRERILADNDRLQKEVAQAEHQKTELTESIQSLKDRKLRALEEINQLSVNALRLRQEEQKLKSTVAAGNSRAPLPSKQASASSVVRQESVLPAADTVPVAETAAAAAAAAAQPAQAGLRNEKVTSAHATTTTTTTCAATATSATAASSAANASACVAAHSDDSPEVIIRRLKEGGGLEGMSTQEQNRFFAMIYEEHEAKQQEAHSLAVVVEMRSQQQHEEQATSARTAAQLQQQQAEEERQRQEEKRQLEENDLRMAQTLQREMEEERETINHVQKMAKQTAQHLAAQAAAQEARGEGSVAAPTQPQGIEAIQARLRAANPGPK